MNDYLNERAFPRAQTQQPGMTLLDWFAGQVLAKVGSDVKYCYDVAEAMMSERRKRGIGEQTQEGK